ncbi:T9SS type A sorting domain-containing protein [Flavobacterium sp. RHBU_24]|uniref:T9SS type A sorting domain-containing protein n=1 Tax=Flavobacterium sp. RHBU_24 TaxID=3391185 RepID=UPI003984D531
MRNFLLFSLLLLGFASYANNECGDAIMLTPGTTCNYTMGTFSGATLAGTAPTCTSESLQDVWYKFTATDATMRISLNATSGLNHGFLVLQGGCGGTVMACVNATPAGNAEAYTDNTYVIGQEYYIRVLNATAQFSSASFGICVTNIPPPTNDLCANAQQLTPGTTCSFTQGTFSGSLKDGSVPSCATNTSQDVWYRFTATDVTMMIELNSSSNLNHGFEIYQGGCSGAVVACINDGGAGLSESYFNNNFIVGQEYYIRVINASVNLSTQAFGICVTKYPTPANDLCADAQQLTPGTTCSFTPGTFSGSLKDGSVPSCATNTSQDVWYRFTATDVTMMIELNSSSNLNHGFEIYQGGCGGAVVACINEGGAGLSESYFNNNFIVGQEYYIRVINASANLSTRAFGICVTKYPTPANDLCANAQQLTPSTTCTYMQGTFSGSLKDGNIPSCATISQQDVWYKFTATDAMISIELESTPYINHAFEVYQGGCDGTLITCTNAYAAGSSESYFSTNFIAGQEYYIRVINALGSLSTRNFNICVRNYPTPANDLCANATEVFPGTTCNYIGGTFSGSANDGTAAVCPSGSSMQDIWYKFVATEQTYSIYLNPVGGFNPGFQIFEGSCSGTMMACVNNYGNNVSEYYQNYNFVIGQTYYVRFFHLMGGYTSQNISFCITKYPKPSNDTCENALVLYQHTTCSEVGATLTGAMFDGPAISCAPQAGQDVWFRFVAEGSSANIYIGPMIGRDLGYLVYQGGCNGTPIACINNYGANLSETANISNLIQGQEYYIQVFNAYPGTTIDSFSICVYGAIQPCNASVSIAADSSQICAGSGATFTATPVNGGATPQYQWKRNGNNVGTNSPVFTASNLVNGDNISVVMTSSVLCPSVPTVTSNIITMNVTTPVVPTFTQVTGICTGGTFTLPATSNNGIAGTWSPAVNNTATTTYTFTPNTGQCASVTTMTVAVNSSVTPLFTQIPAICTGGTFTLPSTSNNGITGTWSPAVNNSVTTTYTFTPNQDQCAITASMTVAVNSNNVTPVFTQIGAICSGGTITLPSVSNNGITGIWSPSVNNTATTTYTFSPNPGQCAIPVTMTVTVNNNVTPTFVQVPAICEGGLFSLPTTSTNSISGTWSPAVNNNATTTYTFTPNAGQCAVPATMTVTVNNNVAPVFSQIAPICQGESFTLPTTSTNGINGIWTPVVNNSVTTTYTFTPNAGQCAITTTKTVVVMVVDASVTASGATITATNSGASYQWINCATSELINLATGASFTAVENGSYAVVVTQNGCSETSECVTVSSLNTGTFIQPGWVVYPNPVNDQLFIDATEPTQVILTDITGKIIGSHDLRSGVNTVNTGSLSAGIYFIKSNLGTYVKFIKK